MAKLRVIAGPYRGVAFDLGTDRITIGRDLDNVIRFPASLVSRHHAEIVRDGVAYKLRDLGSTNGSFVDGNPVLESVIEPGSKIRLADVELEFVPEDPTAAEPGTVPRPAAAPAPAQSPLPTTPDSVTQIRIPPPPQRGVWRPPRPQPDRVPVTLPSSPNPIPAPEPTPPATTAPTSSPPVVKTPPAASAPAAAPAAPLPAEIGNGAPPAAAAEPRPVAGRVVIVGPAAAPKPEAKLQTAPASPRPAEATLVSQPPAAGPAPRPTRQPIFIRSSPAAAKPAGTATKAGVVAPARPAIRTVEVAEVLDKPLPAAAPAAVVRQVSAPSAPAVVDEPAPVEEQPRYRRAWFAVVAFLGLLLIIAGYTLDSNPLRFFGILAVILGVLCVIRDWSPIPGK